MQTTYALSAVSEDQNQVMQQVGSLGSASERLSARKCGRYASCTRQGGCHCGAQVPGGWAAQRWGGRSMLTLSFVLWSTASLLTPVNAQGSAPVAAARVLVGVSQGLLIPSIHTVLASVITPAAPTTSPFSLRAQATECASSVPLDPCTRVKGSRATARRWLAGSYGARVRSNAGGIRCHNQFQTLQ